MKPYNEAECRKFLEKVKADMVRGVATPPGDITPGAPEGYIQFLKDHPELRIKYPKMDTAPKVQCWNCGKEYSIRDTHCPSCGKFNSKRSSIR